MKYEFAVPFRQNITDYPSVKAAFKVAVASCVGTNPNNVVVASSQQGSLCSVPIQKTNSALAFRRLLIDTDTVQIGNILHLDRQNEWKVRAVTKSTKSTVSFAIYGGAGSQSSSSADASALLARNISDSINATVRSGQFSVTLLNAAV